MKQFASILMALLIFAGLTAYTAEGTEPKTKAEAATVVQETAPAIAAAEPAASETTAEATAAADSDVWPAEHGANLPITQQDVNVLRRMGYFLDYTTDYDSATDDGERFLCCGFFGEALFTLCDVYGIPADVDSYVSDEADPLGLMPYDESMEGVRSWHWSRIDAQSADYIVRNVFHNHLGTPGDPAETIRRGYYYLDGYYYIDTQAGGLECAPQIASCTPGENGLYNIWIDWADEYCCFGCDQREVYASILVEASLKMIDGHRMWTIHSIRTLTDDPMQPMG